MPFFHDGEYHVFYLLNNSGNHSINWEHAVSTDLVTWRDLPPALEYDPDDATGPEGGCMFTGSVIERDGVFHAFYTSWNPDNPDGREFVCHATSTDLITWTKHPEHMIAPNGIHYADHQARDFRDPDVVWDEERGRYVMYILANPVANPEAWVFGVLSSADLTAWTQEPHIEGIPGDECPDFFQAGDTFYMHGCGIYAFAENREGPWRVPATNTVDRRMAAKRTFDGRRHVWFGGWLDGPFSIPREVYEGPNGLLYMKPVEEVLAAFDDVQQRSTDLVLTAKTAWQSSVPGDYLLEGTFALGGRDLVLTVRKSGGEGNHQLVLSPRASAILAVGGDQPESRPVSFDSAVTSVQAFVLGDVAEVFVDSRYAATFPLRGEGGILSIEARGDVECAALEIRAASRV
jgi:sucrose-6-phosphate hydrolase SacC (GH32 family)